MKKIFISCSLILSALFILAQTSFCEEPPRGKALYDVLGEGKLVTGGRAPQIIWLPDGSGYLISERDSTLKTSLFYKVNPITEEKEQFFNLEKAKAAYSELTGRKRRGLPFKRFLFSDDGTKIKFGLVSKGLIIYDLVSHQMKQFPKIESNEPTPKLSPDWSQIAFVR